jgi:hypothetical protein
LRYLSEAGVIRWFAEAQCDYNDWDAIGPCEAKTEATLTLKAARTIEVDLPAGWRLRYMANDDSQRDMSHVDVGGDDIRVLCPDHKEDR